MSDIRISRDYRHPPGKLWRALTDPELVAQWTATGRGGAPEGFAPEVGCRFRFIGKPTPGWDGVVRCEVLEVQPPFLLRYSWKGGENGKTTHVTYRIQPSAVGARFTYEHTGFTGVGGFVMAKLVLGPVRRKMLDKGLPGLLNRLDDAGNPQPSTHESQP